MEEDEGAKTAPGDHMHFQSGDCSADAQSTTRSRLLLPVNFSKSFF